MSVPILSSNDIRAIIGEGRILLVAPAGVRFVTPPFAKIIGMCRVGCCVWLELPGGLRERGRAIWQKLWPPPPPDLPPETA